MDKLESLERRGEERAEHERRSRQAEASRDSLQASRRARLMAQVSMTWLGDFWPDDAFDWVGWIVLLFGAPWILPIDLAWKLPVGGALLGLFFAAMILAWTWGAARFRRELEWLKALPFRVEGYVESLGDVSERTSAPFVSGNAVGVRFELIFAAAPAASIEHVAVGFDPKLEVKQTNQPAVWKLRRPDFLGGAANHKLVTYFHRMETVLLEPLARESGLKSVRVRLETLRNQMEDENREMDDVLERTRRG